MSQVTLEAVQAKQTELAVASSESDGGSALWWMEKAKRALIKEIE